MFWVLFSDYWDIGWDNVLETIVFFECLSFSQIFDARLYLFGLNNKCFFLLSKFVDFASETDSLSVEFDHDGPSNIIINFSKIVRIDNLFYEMIPCFDCHLNWCL